MIPRDRMIEIALALPETTTAAHFERTAFRVPRRIFATLGPSGRDLNLRLDPEIQAAVCEARPGAFAPIDNGWGRQGWTRCDLDAVAESDLSRALAEAHALAGLPAPGSAARRAPVSAPAPPRRSTAVATPAAKTTPAKTTPAKTTPAKKTASKNTTAKKTPSRKAVAKKTTAKTAGNKRAR